LAYNKGFFFFKKREKTNGKLERELSEIPDNFYNEKYNKNSVKKVGRRNKKGRTTHKLRIRIRGWEQEERGKKFQRKRTTLLKNVYTRA
jgi:hypothetical protein